jgi:hypothetical protein
VFGLPLSAAVLSMLAVMSVVAGASARVACGDNAAFALAPRDATIAIDARGAADVLGMGGAAARPVLQAIAGEQALSTFDILARRSRQGADAAAREVFAGRVAFFVTEDAAGTTRWMFGMQADDARCERLLKLLGARMQAPGRFASASEKLILRRAGGWLLVTTVDAGEPALDGAASRAAAEDPATSLLGEPLIQDFLASEAPVRVFLRHGPPIGGATMIGVSRAGNTLRADLRGSYDASPLGAGTKPAALDAGLVGAFEDCAAMVVANPSDGLPTGSEAFWLALVPELNPSPAMRANLGGERILAIGPSSDPTRPALALAWLVEDAEQSQGDQDAFMHGVCCGLLRAAEAPTPRDKEFAPVEGNDAQLKSVAKKMADPNHAAGRTCEALGPFIDRYLGAAFKLGGSQLCWGTVATKCGGWQVYATDPKWLGRVSDELSKDPCGNGEKPSVAGVGFCDGARAASLVRSWRPLVLEGAKGSDRLARGLEAVASAVEGLGRIRFRYETPRANRVQATLEIEPSMVPAAPPTAFPDGAPGAKGTAAGPAR